MDHLFDLRPERPGYRLHRLEVFNWGTFDSTDGRVYRFQPDGRTSLLVGHNGSGKSTLVDAILTLLVEPRIRNYNVAAGAKKTERTERSYIRGAFGRTSDESQSTVVNYLRPKGDNLTALAAVFRDEQLDRAFTLCQILYLTADGSPDKVFAIMDEARDLKTDLAGIRSSEAIRGHLKGIGYSTTKTFVEYQGWLARRTEMRSKALDMFNQTVAVKDIQSLNEFIRLHMLESHDWRDKVNRLLKHFDDLSVAHQELVRARKAEELLTPVEKRGQKYREHATALDDAQRKLAAADTFFRVETIKLFEPEIARCEDALQATLTRKERLGEELKDIAERIRQIRNEIDQIGGQRLRDLPVLIREQQTLLKTKQDAFGRYRDLLRRCGIEAMVGDAVSFAAMRTRLASTAADVSEQLTTAADQHEESIAQRGDLRRRLREEQHELEILSQRTTNLPAHLATLRGRMCEDLQLSESVLPYAAELIAVDPDHRRWEASAEMVLRNFALSLLVPERYYRRVRAYVEQTRMVNAKGEGQRLVYLRVGKGTEDAQSRDRLHPQSLLRMLQFRPGHDLTPWVRGEVLRRFDFRCCDSVEEFNETAQFAMTENRHVKMGTNRHEKDDRPRAVDPRHYVLGWDNREKKRRIAELIDGLQSELDAIEQRIDAQGRAVDRLRAIKEASTAALEFCKLDEIDVGRHQREVAALEQEKAELEASNEAVQALRERLRKAEQDQEMLGQERDAAVEHAAMLAKQLEDGKGLVARARSKIDAVRADGQYEGHASEFEAIRESLGDPPVSIENIIERENQWRDDTQRRIEVLCGELQPLSEKLLEAMNRFLREFKEEQTDLDASVHSLDNFLGLLEQIRREDLPRHEKKFKDRLNDKVSQEVALFNAALRQECKQIEGKIEQLNKALAQLEYQPGTHMRLEPREVHDREIADFRRSLLECLDESLENTAEANETRFLRIKRLVERLGDKDNARWREKVIDVRRWYDFAAREVEAESGATRSYYEDSAGQSGGEKAKLAFTILVAAIAYQYDLDPTGNTPGRFHFVVVDEMFSKVDDKNAEYALKLFEQFGLQLLIVAPLDAKARVTEPFVDCYLHVVKNEKTHCSELYSMTAHEYEEIVRSYSGNGRAGRRRQEIAQDQTVSTS
jgi:uncharacterized protein YPO0396